MLSLIGLPWLFVVCQYTQTGNASPPVSSHRGSCSDLLTCPPASTLPYTATGVIPPKWKSESVCPLLKNPPVPPPIFPRVKDKRLYSGLASRE